MEETMEMHKGMTTHWWEQITSQRASVLVQDRRDLSLSIPHTECSDANAPQNYFGCNHSKG